MPRPLLSFFVLLLCCIQLASAQNTDTTAYPIKDISDLISGNKPKKEKPPKNYFIFVTPIIGSSPATRFMFGAAGQITFKANHPHDKYSLVNANAQYTTKNQ